MDILARWVRGRGMFGLDTERVCTKVITLGLEEVGGQVLGTVTIEPRECSREGGCRDTEEGRLGNNISPARLRLVDGLVEEVIEQKVLKIVVLTIGRGDILQKDRPDDASSAPHQGNRGLVELPLEFLGSLYRVSGRH